MSAAHRSVLLALAMATAAMALPARALADPPAVGPALAHQHQFIDCSSATDRLAARCPEIIESDDVFGHYVGHDEPALLFYSDTPGSGNNSLYQFNLPVDPLPNPVPGAASYSFQLHIAAWFGMSLCNTQSYPEQVDTCSPDSDTNIVDPRVSPNHPGGAFLELQFYPPGAGCDDVHWCVAQVDWSLARNPVTGQDLNPTCAAKVGVEYANFAYLTSTGAPLAPPNPLASTRATFDPNLSPARQTLFLMNPGDHVGVSIHDSPDGLVTTVSDSSNGQTGTMTASVANGFAQIQFAPAPSRACNAIPYAFHPMYSTSSPLTRTPWTAHSYNVSFSDETGHFDWCSAVDPTSGACTGLEGPTGDQEPADSDDGGCALPVTSFLPFGGCFADNIGFDGAPYRLDWPDGMPNHPTPFTLTSPLTGSPGAYTQYQRMAFEADLPLIEAEGGLQGCSQFVPIGCTHIPIADDGAPADFYPFYSISKRPGDCLWLEGNDVPGVTTNDFGQQSQYGDYLRLPYIGLGGSVFFRNANFRQIMHNPCPAP
jgi:hypothetical protein